MAENNIPIVTDPCRNAQAGAEAGAEVRAELESAMNSQNCRIGRFAKSS